MRQTAPSSRPCRRWWSYLCTRDGSLRAADRHGLACCRHIAAFRFDAPLSFANAAFLEQEIRTRVADRPTLRHILLVIHGVSGVDEVAAQKLGELVRKLRADGFAVSFSGAKDEVRTVFERTKVAGVVGEENMYPTQAAAIAGIYARAHTGSSEEAVPARTAGAASDRTIAAP